MHAKQPRITRRQALKGAAATALATGLPASMAFGQSRSETLRHVMAGTINSLDATVPGSTREVFGLSANV